MNEVGYTNMEMQAMNIVRTPRTRKLIEEALIPSNGNDKAKLKNVSFMLTPKQIEVIKTLASDNRFSQGIVLRIILDEWMQHQIEGCGQ